MVLNTWVGVEPPVRLDLDGVAVRPPHALGEEIVSTLPDELVEEILLHVPPDEPADLVRATAVCKAWRRILSDDTFRRRYRRFHGTAPLLGYICTDRGLTVRFVLSTTVAASPICKPVFGCSGMPAEALDCRHGRVLIQTMDKMGSVVEDILVVWDPITGSQYNLSMPSFLQDYPYMYGAAVLCAKNGCDHLDCHGGPFLVVILVTSYVGDGDDDGTRTWASVYSSETCVWSVPTPKIMKRYRNDGIPSIFIGDALYFATVVPEQIIIKYDLRKHVLSMIDLPGNFWPTVIMKPTLMKGEDGGLGFASTLHNCIHKWSWRAGINHNEAWVKYRVIDLDAHVPKDGCLQGLICMVGDTDTILIGTDTGIFTFDLKSEQMTKIGQASTHYFGSILPYTSFYTANY